MKLSVEPARNVASRIFANACLLALVSLTAIGSRWSSAATICIAAGDVAGLQSALATASNNGEDDLIELQDGQYSMTTNFLLDYEAVTEHHDLTIEGGYSDNFGNPCGTPPATPDPRLTTLEGGLLRVHLAAGVGSLVVKGVTIQSTFGSDPNHAPVEIFAAPNSTGNITIQNSVFTGNGSTTRPAVYAFSDQGALLIENSLFESNLSFSGEAAVRIGSSRAGGSICTAVINSTFTGNSSSTPGLDVTAPACLALAANDIFWANGAGGDVQFDSPQSTYLVNSDLGDLAEAANTQSSALVAVDPMFRPDFSLQDFSPLRDKGNSGGAIFSPGPFDVIGNARTAGPSLDIGAFEIQHVIFAHGFDFQPPF